MRLKTLIPMITFHSFCVMTFLEHEWTFEKERKKENGRKEDTFYIHAYYNRSILILF